MTFSTQRSLLLATEPAAPFPDIGFELGWDHAHHGVVPPAAHLHATSPVHQGWAAGCQAFGRRTLHADRFVRKWLQLRLGAWLRGRTFEGTQVNPAFLRRIDVAVCPVTREVLTHAAGEPSDASIDRVCNRAGYAAGNLAVMSTRANRAKGGYGVGDALAFARQIEAGQIREVHGLDASQWMRIAVLASFVTHLPHAQAATLPLPVLPPHRVRVLNAVQALQVMLSLQFQRGGHSRRCAALASLMPDAESRQAFHAFMLTLLARRIAAGRCVGPIEERHAIEDLWLDPLVQRRWQRLSLRLTAEDCERIGRAAIERGLAGPGVRWLAADDATEAWALETGGYVTAEVVGRNAAPTERSAPARHAPAIKPALHALRGSSTRIAVNALGR